jgi:AAA domain
LDIDAKFEGAFNDHGEILKEASTSFLETALKSGKIYSGIVQAILNVEQREIDSVLQAKQHKGSDDVSFGVFNNDKIDKYIEHAQSKQKGEFSFAVGDVKDFEENIKVGGQKPTLNHHWDPVVRELEARKQRGDYHREHLEVFAKFGCREEDICNPDGTFTSQFYSQLENARGLREQFTSLKGSVQRQVKRFLKEFSNPRALQHKRAELVEEIQDLEGKLVSELVLAKLGRDVSENQLGYLNQFLQVIGEAKNSAMKVGSNQSLKANTELDDIKTKFREAAKFMPFLVATHDQYFEMVDPTDRTGMVILDEASQSKFTVLNLLFRCNQLMIVGDDQQVSPKVVKREWMDQLKHLAPSIFCRSQLKHGSSFFDACVSAFPRHIFLNEHYRCEPRIANIFNALFYGGDLEPMRLPSSSKVLVSRYVDCGKKPKKEEATTRCMDVASRIVRQIVTSTKSESKIVPTIGIISIGDRSNEAMKKAVADVKNDLRTEFGKDLVEAHNITFGEASRFQGGERDIIVLVDYDKGKKMNDPNSKKIWNVSLSRAKNQLYLVHSYRWDDLKWDDNRKAVLRFFDGTDDSFAKARTVSPLERAPSMRDELHRLYVLAELHLVEAMIENGFLVTRNDDMKRWSHALRISTHGVSGGALVCIENKGETFDNWQATKEQQLSLEKAGRHCLRVPLLSLVLDFRTTAVHVLAFLKSAGLSVSATKLAQNDATSTKKRSITEIQNADTAKQSKTIEEEKKLKEPTSSSVKRGPSEQHVAPPCKRSKGDESDSDSDDLFLHEQTAVAKDTTSNNDSKVRGRVYFKSLHHQAHKKDLKTELRCRGVQFVASKINFGNLKKLLQDNEKNTGSFLPRSDAKFEPKKCGN